MVCQVKSAISKHRKHPLPHFQEGVQVQFKPLLLHNSASDRTWMNIVYSLNVVCTVHHIVYHFLHCFLNLIDVLVFNIFHLMFLCKDVHEHCPLGIYYPNVLSIVHHVVYHLTLLIK